MSSQCGVLVGVCRPVPEGGTFVVPVFRTDDGKHVTQRVADGWIAGLEEVSFAEEFVPLASAVRVNVGDAAICGIELDDYICVGWAPSLGKSIKGPVAPALSVFRRKEDETFDLLEGTTRVSALNSFNAALRDRSHEANTADLFTAAVGDFMQALDGHVNPLREKRPLPFKLRGIAASLLLAIALILGLRGYLEPERIVTTGSAEVLQMALPDGSTMYVDARSKVEVAYTDAERIVHIYSGGALFEVAKDPNRPFIVKTELIDAKAVGTRFGVSIAPGVTATVSEGVVEIRARGEANGKVVRLKAGDELRVTDSSLVSPYLKQVDAERKLQWANGMLILGGLSVAEGVEQLNRRNRVQIVVDNPALGNKVIAFASVKLDAEAPKRYAEIVAAEPGVTLDETKDVIRLSE